MYKKNKPTDRNRKLKIENQTAPNYKATLLNNNQTNSYQNEYSGAVGSDASIAAIVVIGFVFFLISMTFLWELE